jgi:hypothetical protein
MLSGPSNAAATAICRHTLASKAFAAPAAPAPAPGGVAAATAIHSSSRPVRCIDTAIAMPTVIAITPSQTVARLPLASHVPADAPTASPAMNTPTIALNAYVVGPTISAITRVHTT